MHPLKKVGLILCCIIAGSSMSSAQEQAVHPDSAANQILNELQIIRSIHKETHEQRQRSIADRQRRDSIRNIKSNKEMLSDYGLMAQIEDNTHQYPISDGWNLYGITAFCIAVASAFISWYTFKAQQRTVGNTKRLSQDMQRQLLNELLRHLYRNYIITYTMRTKMKDIDYNGYPSEEHFEKLKIPMENIHLDAFYGDDKKFSTMHVLYLNLRNYNNEIDVALKHMLERDLSRKTKDEDFDTLEFKVSYLSERIINVINTIWGKTEANKQAMIDAINVSLEGTTNATDNIDVPDSADFEKMTLKTLKETAYAKLYSDADLKKFCKTFNNDVHEERKKNKRGAWKVRMIRY